MECKGIFLLRIFQEEDDMNGYDPADAYLRAVIKNIGMNNWRYSVWNDKKIRTFLVNLIIENVAGI